MTSYSDMRCCSHGDSSLLCFSSLIPLSLQRLCLPTIQKGLPYETGLEEGHKWIRWYKEGNRKYLLCNVRNLSSTSYSCLSYFDQFSSGSTLLHAVTADASSSSCSQLPHPIARKPASTHQKYGTVNNLQDEYFTNRPQKPLGNALCLDPGSSEMYFVLLLSWHWINPCVSVPLLTSFLPHSCFASLSLMSAARITLPRKVHPHKPICLRTCLPGNPG